MTDTRKILIVDDNTEFVDSTRDLLEAAGYRVVVAYNGESGLETAKAEKPDLMLLDVMMTHDTEGFEVSRKIPETPELRHMPVILVTGIRHDKDLAYGFEPDETWLPVDKVLEKPVPPETLLKEVEAALKA
jgi:CheY-like chemotaxis protein